MHLDEGFPLALGLPGGIPKYIKIPTCFQDPRKSEKVSPRPPTDIKMIPKTIPPAIKLVNKWKKWNHSRNIVFYHSLSTYSQCILASFPSLDHQKHEPGHSLPFWYPNHRKTTKWCQSESQETPQIQPKIDKDGHLGFSVSIGCPSGPQDHQNAVQGIQEGASRSPK